MFKNQRASMKYIYKRCFYGLFTVFLALIITFVLVYNMPGDPIVRKAVELAESTGKTYEEAYEMAKAMFGRFRGDAPLHELFLRFLSSVFRGEFGHSLIYDTTVSDIIASSAPWTIFTALTGVWLSFFLAVKLGTYSAFHRGTKKDTFLVSLSVFFDTMPSYVTALLALLIFGVLLGIFPLHGAFDPMVTPGFNLDFLVSVLHHAFLPILTYSLPITGAYFLTMRSTAVSILGEDYIYAGWAKGLKEKRIISAYVSRGAMLPLLAAVTITIGTILGGSILIERIFVYPGMGFQFLSAFQNYDFNLLSGLFLMQIFGLTIATIIADLIYAKLDPRVRFE